MKTPFGKCIQGKIGFMASSSRILTPVLGDQQCYQQSVPGCRIPLTLKKYSRPWVTVLACVSADDQEIPPMIIVKGENP